MSFNQGGVVGGWRERWQSPLQDVAMRRGAGLVSTGGRDRAVHIVAVPASEHSVCTQYCSPRQVDPHQ